MLSKVWHKFLVGLYIEGSKRFQWKYCNGFLKRMGHQSRGVWMNWKWTFYWWALWTMFYGHARAGLKYPYFLLNLCFTWRWFYHGITKGQRALSLYELYKFWLSHTNHILTTIVLPEPHLSEKNAEDWLLEFPQDRGDCVLWRYFGTFRS